MMSHRTRNIRRQLNVITGGGHSGLEQVIRTASPYEIAWALRQLPTRSLSDIIELSIDEIDTRRGDPDLEDNGDGEADVDDQSDVIVQCGPGSAGIKRTSPARRSGAHPKRHVTAAIPERTSMSQEFRTGRCQ